MVVAIVWLAPPFTRLLPGPSWTPFPSVVERGLILPERLEHTRYLVAVVAPFVLVGFWLAVGRLLRPAGPTVALPWWYVAAVQLEVLAFAVACWVFQRQAYSWFGYRTLLVAGGLGFALLALAWRGWIVPKAPRVGRVRRLAGSGVALVLTGYWLLPAVYRTANAVNVADFFGQLFQIQFVQDELASVLNGRTPMVNFSSQYAKLLPFVLTPVLWIFDPSIEVTTIAMATLGIVALVAVYGIFVVLTEDPLIALLLYVPFLALCNYVLFQSGDERITLAGLFGVVPIRVLGPFVVGWLCVRQLRKGGERGRVPLFVLAGLFAVNNTEFGAGAFVALALAFWCGHDGQSAWWPRAVRLAAQATVGGVVSLLAVCILTLVRNGALPDPEVVDHMTRVFAVEGFGMVPISPAFGLHVLIYLTFVAALAAGVIGSLTSHDGSPRARVQRGLLAYCGLLGLGAGAYWVGRSVPLALVGMFPTWGLSVCVLCWAFLRGVAARPKPSLGNVVRWALPATGAAVAFGLMMTVVVQIPSPAGQLRRFRAAGGPVPAYDARVRFIDRQTSQGERVAILAPVGHVLARAAGVTNVSPYASEVSIAFDEQMDFLFGLMRRSGATKVFVGNTWPETSAYLLRSGYVLVATDAPSLLAEFQRASG